MPINIKDKVKCNGCSGCYNICPKNCITMEADENGFSYPVIDKSVCINCDLCKKVCPLLTESNHNNNFEEPTVYAAWSNNEDIRLNSTSGGIFSELAQAILKNQGKIVGAQYNTDNIVEHVMINDYAGLEKIRQSKYTQSNIGSIYREIKQNLNEKETILFCGAPCHVAALKSYLNKEYKNLITVDFICRGVNSPKAYYYWLKELEEKYESKARKVWFKYKINGWKNSPTCTRIDFEDGKHCVVNAEENKFMQGYLGPNLYIRPSCSDCKFKGVPRQSDITLADFWGISDELDDDKGTSLVLINSIKGEKLFNLLKEDIFFEQRSFKEISRENVCFQNSVIINKKSSKFLEELGRKPFSKVVNKYTKISIARRIIRKGKRVLKKIIIK